jgi:hypothetical protein
MRIAISEFAPGNEIVREKKIYTPIGLAGFRPVGKSPEPVHALGPVIPVGLCDIESYEGISQKLSRASTPKLATPMHWDQEHATGGMRVRGTHHQIWQVNDNRGDGFALAQSTQPAGGWLAEDLAPTGWTQGTAIPHVIGAMITTDVLVCEPSMRRTTGSAI